MRSDRNSALESSRLREQILILAMCMLCAKYWRVEKVDKTGSLPVRSGVAGKATNQAHGVSRLSGGPCAPGSAGLCDQFLPCGGGGGG